MKKFVKNSEGKRVAVYFTPDMFAFSFVEGEEEYAASSANGGGRYGGNADMLDSDYAVSHAGAAWRAAWKLAKKR